MANKLTKEQKDALRKAEKFFDSFSKETGLQMAKWAMNKVLAGQTEKQKLIKEKAKIEARLVEIEKSL